MIIPFLRKFIDRVENQPMGWFSTVFTLFSVILLRNFLEGILEEAHTITLLEDVYRSIITNFIHFLFCYGSIFLAITIILTLITKGKFKNVLKTVVLFSPILLIPPLVDFLILRTGGLNISYTTRSVDFLRILLTGPFYGGSIEGITPGMRIEVAALYLLVFFYVLAKGTGVLKAMLNTVIVHLSVTILVDLPHLIAILARKDFTRFYGAGSLLTRDTQKFGIIYLLLFSVLLLAAGLLFRRSFMKKVLKSIRYIRSINYTGAVLFGFLIGYALLREYVQFLFTNPWDYLAVLSLIISIFLSFSGAVIFNDMSDIKTDSVSRRRNPLTSGAINKNRYRSVGIIFFALGFLFALNTSYTAFFLVLILVLISFIYSSPPFRIKRVPLLSTFSLSFSTLLCLMLGYSLFAGGKAFISFPHRLQLLFLVSLTLGFTPKDLVDARGDRVSKILTIPVLFGERTGKLITFLLVSFGYLFVPILFHALFLTILSLTFIILTGAEFLMKKINEKVFLFTYYAFSLAVVLFLFFNPQILQQNDSKDLGLQGAGDHYFDKGDFASSMIMYASIPLPTDRALLNAGISAFKTEAPQKAILLLMEYLKRDPYEADVYSYLTNAYLKTGQNDLASAVNTTAIEMSLDLKRFLSEKGILLFHAGEREAAEEYLHTSYFLGYRASSLLFYLSRRKIEAKQYSSAAFLLEKLIERDRKNIKALAELGKLRIETREYHESISIYTKALHIKKEPLFYNNIGVSYQRLGMSDSASIFFKRALALNPHYLPARKNLDNLMKSGESPSPF